MSRRIQIVAAAAVSYLLGLGDGFAISISGTVADSGGSGIVGVEVRLFELGGAYFNMVASDATGDYEVTGVPAGSYVVWTRNEQGYIDELYDDMVCAGGCYFFGGTPIPVSDGNNATGIDFSLADGGRISGVVTASVGGMPLQGVEVKTYSAEGDLITVGLTSAAGAYTSPSGLPSGDYSVRTANGEGYFDELYDNQLCPGSCDVTLGDAVAVVAGSTTPGIDFALDSGGRIAGLVTSSGDGAPITNVRVDIYDSAGSLAASATPDASGAYITDTGLASGSYFALTDNWWGHIDELYDNIPCAAGCTPVDGTPIAVSGGVTNGINFALDPGGWITGTVTDSVTGLPIEEVGVEIFNELGQRVTTAMADVSGVYWGSGLPTGSYKLRAYSWARYLTELYDNIPCYGGCDLGSGAAVEVIHQAITSGVDFSLDLGGEIAGSVTDGSGQPIGEADIAVFDGQGNPITDTHVDQFGNFSSTPIPTGTYFLITDAWGDWVIDEIFDDIPCVGFCDPESGTSVVLSEDSTATVAIELVAGGSIAGSVMSNGNPVANCELMLIDDQGAEFGVTATDTAGCFEFSAMPVSNYYLHTLNGAGLVDQVWQGVACSEQCLPTVGTLISVGLEQTTSGIDFALTTADLFADSYESGDIAVCVPLTWKSPASTD